MMIFRNNKQEKHNENLTIKIGNEKIDNVSTYHYLGIDLDSTLLSDKMLDCMYNKANRKLYMLKRIRPLITNSVAALVYKTHVLPMLDYGDFLVDSGKLSKIDRLNNLHKRAVKLIDKKAHRDQDIVQFVGSVTKGCMLRKSILFLFLKSVTHVLRQIEHLDCLNSNVLWNSISQ